MDLTIYTDGGSRGNPGPASAGVVITDLHTNQPLHEAGYFLGKCTNNVAEYQGLVKALKLVAPLGADEVQIHSDSELMVRQITGQYRVKSPALKPLLEQVERLLLKVNSWHIRHVKRDKNKRADEMANLAMDAGRDVIVTTDESIPLDPLGKPDVAGSIGPDEEQGMDEAAVWLMQQLGGEAADDQADDDAEDGPAPPTAAKSGKSKPAGPCAYWTVGFAHAPGEACPAPALPGQTYAFGPDTPADLCIYAAAAVFAKNPANWAKQDRRRDTATCKRCQAAIDIELIEQADA